MSRTFLTETQKDEMVRAYLNNDYSAKVIASRWQCGERTLARALHDRGLSYSDRNKGVRKAWRERAKRTGGRWIDKKGYVMVHVPTDSPFRSMCQGKNSYAPEHRIVVAKELSRPLTKSETVHHIDGDRQNNRIENLQLRNGHHGSGQAWSCMDCGSHNIRAVKLAGGNQ